MWFSHNLELVAEVAEATEATEATEVVSRPAPRTPPSTRAGGQDDGSLNKLPQKHIFATTLRFLVLPNGSWAV